MSPDGTSRRPWSGAPGGPGPGRREGDGQADAAWELWNLRALWPDATAGDLAALRRRRGRILAREREALAGLWSGDTGILAPGHGFVAAHPELGSGLLVTFHQGPYALVLEILLHAGHTPLVLVSKAARRRNEPLAAGMANRLGLPDRITWLEVEQRGSLRRLVAGLREGRPVVAYLDGNLGAGGFADTRERGLDYELPGRTVRVRTGLARLAVRCGAPLRPLAVHWGDDGQPVWTALPALATSPGDDTDRLTTLLFDWCFGHIMVRPEQWTFWAMLKESAACFARSALDEDTVPSGLRQDYARAFAVCLERSPETARLRLECDAAVWPGSILADLSRDRFFPAVGLCDDDLVMLQGRSPTLAELVAARGEEWVRFHGVRLCLLGMARLAG